MTWWKRPLAGGVLSICVAAACGGVEPEPGPELAPGAETVGTSEQGLYQGTLTCARREVGRMNNGCTATLIAPDMILTAAHCVGYTTSESGVPGSYSFGVNNSSGCGTPLSIPLKRWYSFGGAAGATDVAIGHLAWPVPSSLATPLNVGSSMPGYASFALILGHGARNYTVTPTQCAPTDGNKAVSSFYIDGNVSGNTRLARAPTYQASMCPGDSGGPSIHNEQIFWVNSATTMSGNDVLNHHGEAWRYSATGELDSRMASWACSGGIWFNGAAVGKEDRYPYARVCGLGGQSFECDHARRIWQPVGGSCGNTAYQCSGGTAFGGIAIPPHKTSLGSTHCGMDQLVYECTTAGWAPRLGSWCGPGLDFDTMPTWSSTYDASWGGAATWTTIAGQTLNALRSDRSVTGSSARVKQFSIKPNTNYTISIFMRGAGSAGDYWTEAAFKLGSYGAMNFDNQPATWTMINKFDRSNNGNGNVWMRYQRTFNSGANSVVSVGLKHGALALPAPAGRWDTLRIE